MLKATTAYEVHTCLAEVLERGTADKAFTELGLKRFPLGGKTGTAYNFTDCWFLGYSSAVTCGVWAGFDKPRTPIYRGAFSNEIALPIWTSIMQETFANYQAAGDCAAAGSYPVEICAASGLLATNKCFETIENKETGEKTQRATTYSEIATEAQAPKEACDVHGDTPRTTPPREQSRPGSQWPRAEPVQNLAVLTPVPMKSPTILGEDPYNSAQAAKIIANMRNLNGQVAPVYNNGTAPPADPTAPPEMQVRRAEKATVVLDPGSTP